MDLDAVVKGFRRELAPCALAVKGATEFTLQMPCALIAEGEVITTNLAGLRGYLPCSVALASEPIERFLLLRTEHGFDKAFEICSSDGADGEAFVEAWDCAQRDLEQGVVCTLNDICAMFDQARRWWLETPRRMLVVVREGSAVDSGLVPVDWVLAG